MTRADIAIIGTGPAGLEAALTAKNRNKSILLYGSKTLSNKIQTVDHAITNYLGLPNITGKQMAEAFYAQIEDAGIEIVEKRVTAVYAMGDYFILQLSDNTTEEASSVILAAGVTAGKPYPGEEQFLGRGVSYCATCDAPLYRGKVTAVIAQNAEEESEADFLGEVCEKVYYFPLYKDEPHFTHDNIIVVRERPEEIQGMMKVNTLVTDQNKYTVDCVFVLRTAQFPSQLVPGLEADGNAVKTDAMMNTNIPGLFAAGDVTGQPYQYIRAAGQGNVAAYSAAVYLDKMKRENA